MVGDEWRCSRRFWTLSMLSAAVLSACSKPGLDPEGVAVSVERRAESATATVPETEAKAEQAPEVKNAPARPLDLSLQFDPSESTASEQTEVDAQQFQKKVLPEMFEAEPGERSLSVSGGLLHRPEYEVAPKDEGFVDSIKGAELKVTVKTR